MGKGPIYMLSRKTIAIMLFCTAALLLMAGACLFISMLAAGGSASIGSAETLYLLLPLALTILAIFSFFAGRRLLRKSAGSGDQPGPRHILRI